MDRERERERERRRKGEEANHIDEAIKQKRNIAACNGNRFPLDADVVKTISDRGIGDRKNVDTRKGPLNVKR